MPNQFSNFYSKCFSRLNSLFCLGLAHIVTVLQGFSLFSPPDLLYNSTFVRVEAKAITTPALISCIIGTYHREKPSNYTQGCDTMASQQQ